ncbi:TIGR04282 family arsenosugar biosynthesis glycosyltransferase [Longispora sp. K20-0274]|uniref:TIGR04282 family arsenosugar biosynthesis glycosyltransferase n=1 Tax=Longispora sp. K20-0274 TaxID=3088255 RepID=UPI003999B352
MRIMVVAKQPVPGRVKTRLCPPCTPEQAADLATAALEDTLDAVRAVPAARTLLLDGVYPAPGFDVLAQRGDGLGERLANGFADRPGPTLLIGMDTPQADPELLGAALAWLGQADAVLGLAEDGGWWALGLRDPAHGALLRDVPMSTPDTGRLTALALATAGLRVLPLPVLRDVDTIADAAAVAALAPHGRFARAVAALDLGSRVRTDLELAATP